MDVPHIKITNIPKLNTIVIRQYGMHFFIAARDSIVIDYTGMYNIISYLVNNSILDREIIRRIINGTDKT